MRKTLAFVLLAVPALAQAPPPPAPELSQLKPFEGTFACTGTAPQSAFTPVAHKTEATVKGGADLNGYWYLVRYEEKKTAENPNPITALSIWGYDSTQKKFTGSCLDSFGGFCHQTSPGWEGDALVFTGEAMMGRQKMGARDTFGRKGTTITHKGELQMEGKWILLDEETCTRK